MALIVCKECKNKVSDKAKTCPSCGAKVPKKTSLFTWIIFIVFSIGLYTAVQIPKSNKRINSEPVNVNKQGSINSLKTDKAKKIVPPKPSWTVSTSKDKMTNKFSAYAASPIVFPTKRMSFPYNKVNSWMGVGCNSEREWAYLGFSHAPNLTKDETKDGYNLIVTRVKWDKQVENTVLTQDWGAKFIHFREDSFAIAKITSSSSMLLELHWHGQQPAYFDFTLNGSSKALEKIRALCLKNK